ncbi:hypothetical protein [Actinokineospora enzanensis]|uniref:hypothetical protein n=1 Tax=Actinokineospora enzanensis TaxID=155975 RepID=UPI000361B3D6|nr:hypothetical protein [Actinokineospora enzanensis]
MSTTLHDTQDEAEIQAASLLAEVFAGRLAALRVASAGRMLRLAFPAAASILVDTTAWYYHEEHGSGDVDLVSIRDADGRELWNDEDGPTPELPDVDGGWHAVHAAAESELFSALDHLTPDGCGWESFEREDHSDTDVFRIELPAPGQQQTEPLAERALTRLRPLAVQLGLTLTVA